MSSSLSSIQAERISRIVAQANQLKGFLGTLGEKTPPPKAVENVNHPDHESPPKTGRVAEITQLLQSAKSTTSQGSKEDPPKKLNEHVLPEYVP